MGPETAGCRGLIEGSADLRIGVRIRVIAHHESAYRRLPAPKEPSSLTAGQRSCGHLGCKVRPPLPETGILEAGWSPNRLPLIKPGPVPSRW